MNLNEETIAAKEVLKPMLVGLNQINRETIVNGFKQAVMEHASEVIRRETFRETKTDEEEIQACIVQLVAALGLIAAVNRVEWDQISEPELKPELKVVK